MVVKADIYTLNAFREYFKSHADRDWIILFLRLLLFSLALFFSKFLRFRLLFNADLKDRKRLTLKV